MQQYLAELQCSQYNPAQKTDASENGPPRHVDSIQVHRDRHRHVCAGKVLLGAAELP